MEADNTIQCEIWPVLTLQDMHQTIRSLCRLSDESYDVSNTNEAHRSAQGIRGGVALRAKNRWSL
ncbi:MAG: hypothetical protein AMXMBFR84_48910 [Candidatus Hydrogenedentota bacterium]